MTDYNLYSVKCIQPSFETENRVRFFCTIYIIICITQSIIKSPKSWARQIRSFISSSKTLMTLPFPQLQNPMVIHVYHPYRQPDGVNHCAAVNGHCSHLCLPAPRIGPHSPRVSCACPNGLRLLPDNQMCVEDSKYTVTRIWIDLFWFI